MRTGHRPGTTPQQWAFARVNSMLTGGKADPDLQPQARAAKLKEEKKKHLRRKRTLIVYKNGSSLISQEQNTRCIMEKIGGGR